MFESTASFQPRCAGSASAPRTSGNDAPGGQRLGERVHLARGRVEAAQRLGQHFPVAAVAVPLQLGLDLVVAHEQLVRALLAENALQLRAEPPFQSISVP